MKNIIRILIISTLVVIPGMTVFAAQSASPDTFVIPTFVIKAVDQNDFVTIQTDNLHLNDSYNVTMGLMGTKGINGIVVGKVSTTTSGRITKTFTIPDSLKGLSKIAIRLQSPTTGYYAYNWFYNADANLDIIGSPEETPPSSEYSGYPYFFIAAVDKGTSVTVNEHNFPPNSTFYVRMNWMWTRGIAGAIVETVSTDASGNLSDTKYLIPDFLQGSSRIAIRLESPSTGYYAYNWFYNNDAP